MKPEHKAALASLKADYMLAGKAEYFRALSKQALEEGLYTKAANLALSADAVALAEALIASEGESVTPDPEAAGKLAERSYGAES